LLVQKPGSCFVFRQAGRFFLKGAGAAAIMCFRAGRKARFRHRAGGNRVMMTQQHLEDVTEASRWAADVFMWRSLRRGSRL